MNKHYYHLCANGADVRHFILSVADYHAVFNIIGVCAANTDVVVVSFSIEDSHPHILLYGTLADCARFREMFESLYRHYAYKTRKGQVPVVFRCDLYWIDDINYLRNVAVYTIIQATKDGKPVMHYDYRWGTGSLYFRSGRPASIWQTDSEGLVHDPVPFSSLTVRARRALLHSRRWSIPDDWLVCNGLILPENYIDIKRFEQIYQSHNRFRVFLASPRKIEQEMLEKMAEARGVAFEDMEARRICGDECKMKYGFRDPRKLDGRHRIDLAQYLRTQYRFTLRQIASLVFLPESEVQRYVR